ncbi:hypothetical protein IMZ48_48765 [Candidatus Bathyarchaeota archaeon]|nr:hypothetical protein [Candidatus Bathyarchaeota archaeon]
MRVARGDGRHGGALPRRQGRGGVRHDKVGENIRDTRPSPARQTTNPLSSYASLLHHIFAVTPEGQYLLKLLQNVHKLIPYAAIRQILRLGNAATMLNALLKLLLAKFGLATISNWVGFTQGADEGMNLLQRWVSSVGFGLSELDLLTERLG